MVVTLSQQYSVGEKPTVILYTYINHHAQLPVITQHTDCRATRIVLMSIIVLSNHTSRGLGNQKNVGVYCTISLIAMHWYRTNTEYTGSLAYNSVYRKIRTHKDLLSLKKNQNAPRPSEDRMGVTEGDLSIDVDVILGNCTIYLLLYVFNERSTPA